jgi:excisionase family DNA binding protein
MNNEDVIQQITDIVCNRFEDMIKSMVSANLENGIGSQDYSPLVEAITVDELASLLKISKPVAYELANNEGFPSFRIGKNIRVDKRGLSDWMSKQTAVRKGTQQT